MSSMAQKDLKVSWAFMLSSSTKAGRGTLPNISRIIFNQSVYENLNTHCASGN